MRCQALVGLLSRFIGSLPGKIHGEWSGRCYRDVGGGDTKFQTFHDFLFLRQNEKKPESLYRPAGFGWIQP
jgi:hypothetical protein